MSKALANPRADLKGRPTEELVRELVGLLGYTAEKLQRMAFIVAELESRGHPTTAIRDHFLMRQLRRIAAGDLLPEVIQHLLGSPTVIDAVARLPIAEQKRLLDSGKVDVLVDGAMQPIDLARLTSESVNLAFGPDHLRNEAEQRQHIKQLKRIEDLRTERSEPAPEPIWRVQAIPDRNGIKVGNTFAKVEDIVPVLAELKGPLEVINVDDATLETATVRLTAKEKRKLKAAEKRRGLPEWHLIREALRAYGLI